MPTEINMGKRLKDDMQGIYFFLNNRATAMKVRMCKVNVPGAGIHYHANGNKYVGNFKDGIATRKGVLVQGKVRSMTANGRTNWRDGRGTYKWNVG